MADSSVLRHPFRNDHYTSRVPTPPRIVVPPPALNSDALPDISIKAIQSSTYAFLQGVDYDNLIQTNPPLDWTYERRRQAQTILPFLCLGPMTAAKDEKWLQEQGVTMLLGVRQKHNFQSRLMQGNKTAERLGIEAQSVDLSDNQDLIRNFQHINHMINDHLSRTHQATNGQRLGKVLVYCESGNERSAGAVAAYLMEAHQDVDHIKAMQLCQAQRFCVNFDDSMKRLLEGYWDIISAKRAVQEQQAEGVKNMRANGHAVNGANNLPAPRAKRGLERDDDEDADMEGGDDMERFGGRTFVPFNDHGEQAL